VLLEKLLVVVYKRSYAFAGDKQPALCSVLSLRPSVRGHIMKVCDCHVSLTTWNISPNLHLRCSCGQR